MVFVWWIGIVEDRQDPLKLGRVRVRCVGWHAENKMLLPTNMLPFFYAITIFKCFIAISTKRG
jgi:hypothetical protein